MHEPGSHHCAKRRIAYFHIKHRRMFCHLYDGAISPPSWTKKKESSDRKFHYISMEHVSDNNWQVYIFLRFSHSESDVIDTFVFIGFTLLSVNKEYGTA